MTLSSSSNETASLAHALAATHITASQPPSSLSSRPASPNAESVDEVVLTALRNSRDRVFFIQYEREMSVFVKDTNRQKWDLPLMNTYQRLLVHRCADQYRLERYVDMATKVVTLTKTEATRLPSTRISQRAATILGDRELAGASSPAGTPAVSTPPNVASGSGSAPPSGFRIMRRNPTNSPRSGLTPAASVSGSNSDSERSEGACRARPKDRKDMTIEEREAAYKAARERIFGASVIEGTAEASSATASATKASTIDKRKEQVSSPSMSSASRTSSVDSFSRNRQSEVDLEFSRNLAPGLWGGQARASPAPGYAPTNGQHGYSAQAKPFYPRGKAPNQWSWTQDPREPSTPDSEGKNEAYPPSLAGSSSASTSSDQFPALSGGEADHTRAWKPYDNRVGAWAQQNAMAQNQPLMSFGHRGHPSSSRRSRDDGSHSASSSTRSSPLPSSLPQKPAWIQKNGSGSEAGTPRDAPSS